MTSPSFHHPFVYTSLALLLGAGFASADVKMPWVFGDHMVLQQEQTVPVWGWADPGESVTVNFGGQSAQTQGGPDGKWRVDLHPFPADTQAQTMTVTGKNTLTFNDVLLGDVWIAAGQSNMEIPVGACPDAKDDIAKADDPQLRFFTTNPITTLTPENGLRKPHGPHPDSVWFVASPTTVPHCSGISYFFGRQLRQKLNRPIGMINSTCYSSAAEAWTPVETIQANVSKDPMLQTWLDARDAEIKIWPPIEDAFNKQLAAYPDTLQHWLDVDLPAYKLAMVDWNKQRDDAVKNGQPPPPQPPNGIKPQPPMWPGAGGIQICGNLYNGMIAPLVPYAIKGVIWYQGEANEGRADQYQWLLPAMIDGWRKNWGEGDFPFLLVQLAAFNTGFPDPAPPRQKWAWLREAQFQIANRIKNSGIATPIDVGSEKNIHPRDKKDPGERMGLVALHNVYGQDIVYSGPTFSSMKIEGNKIRITFANTGSGLVIATPPWTAPDETPSTTEALHNFAIAGDDQKWVWGKAEIDGNDVVVSSDQVPNPVAVRFAWANYPLNFNFYNKEGLPAFPFRTDNWPSDFQ